MDFATSGTFLANPPVVFFAVFFLFSTILGEDPWGRGAVRGAGEMGGARERERGRAIDKGGKGNRDETAR